MTHAPFFRSILGCFLLWAFLGAQSLPAQEAPKADIVPEVMSSKWQPIDLQPFGSGIHHWRRIRDHSRFVLVEPSQQYYSADQVPEIVSNILLYQRDDGGWPKDYDMTAILSPAQRFQVLQTQSRQDSSYDNGNIHSQVEYLARAYSQCNDPTWKLACERGFDFMLASQYGNGGFPQQFPRAKGYSAHITFNDGVMMGILNLLLDTVEQQPHLAWIDGDRREKARAAVERSVDCLLKCQIEVAGVRTGWCQQHDQETFEARAARSFELASICPQETTSIVQFLMRDPHPSAEIIQAIDAAVDWLRSVQLSGIRLQRIAAPSETFVRHEANYDWVVVHDENAPPTWARHYEIGTNRPIFASRDGIKKYSFAEIDRERRTGSQWYGGWPDQLLNHELSAWSKRVGYSR